MRLSVGGGRDRPGGRNHLARRARGAAEAAGQEAEPLDWLAIRVGMLGIDFEVHEPPELVERFRLLAGRFGRATNAAS